MPPSSPAHRVALVRAGRAATSAETVELRGVDGTPLAVVDQAPPLLANLTVKEVRRLAPDDREPTRSVLRRAGRLFASARLNGLTPESYCALQARASGIPIKVAYHALQDIEAACADMLQRTDGERPAGIPDVIEPGEIKSVWRRRGDVLSVIAPSNNPGTHVQWIEALALGYRIVIRPGNSDPFTPARLVAALLAAGVEATYLSLLSGSHSMADALVEAADLSLVFGGDSTMKRYADNRSVIRRGPGRSKLLHTGPITDEALDVICASVAYDAGCRCTNATAVFTEADPRTLGEAIAGRLTALRPAPPQSPAAQLPVLPIDSASALREHLDARRAGAVDVAAAAYPDGVLADLGDGSAALRPAVLVCDRTDHPGAGIELPFPCVWVLPWSRSDGLLPLRNTLALTILGDDEYLAQCALREPSIRQVLLGSYPTFYAGITSPHDGYLSHDLMEARAFGLASPAVAEWEVNTARYDPGQTYGAPAEVSTERTQPE